MSRIAGSVQALLSHLIDYAGLFPPASLSLEEAMASYESYANSPERWILNRLILPAGSIGAVPPDANWRISVLADQEPGPLPAQVESLETRLNHRLSLPTYCEAPVETITGAFAKFRTGGVTPSAIPALAQVAAWISAAARKRMAFKATAGLHHAIRSTRALTYAADSPREVMHGFLNVFVSASFAWHGMDARDVERALAEEDVRAFEFREEEILWRGNRLGAGEISQARREFAHSFGSCSFDEPVAELRELGLIP